MSDTPSSTKDECPHGAGDLCALCFFEAHYEPKKKEPILIAPTCRRCGSSGVLGRSCPDCDSKEQEATHSNTAHGRFDADKSQASMPRRYEHIDRVDLWIMAQRQYHEREIGARDEEIKALKGVLNLKQDEYVQQVGTWKIISRLEAREKELEAEIEALRAQLANALEASDFNNDRFIEWMDERKQEVEALWAVLDRLNEGTLNYREIRDIVQGALALKAGDR